MPIVHLTGSPLDPAAKQEATPPPLPRPEGEDHPDLPDEPTPPPAITRIPATIPLDGADLTGFTIANIESLSKDLLEQVISEGGVLINEILQACPAGTSDIQIRTDGFVRFHTNTGIEIMRDVPRLPATHVLAMLLALLRSRTTMPLEEGGVGEGEIAMLRRLQNNKCLDFAVEGGNLLSGLITKGRLRLQAFFSNSGLAMTARILQDKPPSLESLGFAKDFVAIMQQMVLKRSGLCLVTGVTGSGKTTTLAALIEWVKCNHDRHIVSLEEPIEYRYSDCDADGRPTAGFVTQQEVGSEILSFSKGLVDALRKRPHIILVGEIRDAETMEAAFRAVMTGHLVLGTLHTQSASRTIARIIDLFPSDRTESILNQLADSIRFILSQGLLPAAQGHSGKVLAYEFFACTDDAARSAIRQYNKDDVRLEEAIARSGNILWSACLRLLVNEGRITPQTEMENSIRRSKNHAELA
jgi:pilus retraction protein PilT